MFRMTFGTKGQNWKGSLETTVEMPSDIQDMELIIRRFGSVKRMVNRANAMWRVDCATGKKTRTAAEYTAYVQTFCDDGAKDSSPRQTVIEDNGFSDEQIAALRAANIFVVKADEPTDEDEEQDEEVEE